MTKNINRDNLIEFLSSPEKLPERAFTVLPGNPKQVIIVVKGETGYYQYQEYETEGLATDTVEYANGRLGICPEAAEALQIMSMRGTW